MLSGVSTWGFAAYPPLRGPYRPRKPYSHNGFRGAEVRVCCGVWLIRCGVSQHIRTPIVIKITFRARPTLHGKAQLIRCNTPS